MKEILGIASFIIIFGVTIPYIKDIIGGKVKLARSTRMLYVVLFCTTLIVQARDFSSWALALTVGEALSQIVLLGFAFRYGIGGFQTVDKISYALFIVALVGYVTTGETLLGLVLLCATDLAAFVPTIIKNWSDPATDTPLFFAAGVIASMLAILAASDITDANQLIVPVYLAVVNAIMVIILLRARLVSIKVFKV